MTPEQESILQILYDQSKEVPWSLLIVDALVENIVNETDRTESEVRSDLEFLEEETNGEGPYIIRSSDNGDRDTIKLSSDGMKYILHEDDEDIPEDDQAILTVLEEEYEEDPSDSWMDVSDLETRASNHGIDIDELNSKVYQLNSLGYVAANTRFGGSQSFLYNAAITDEGRRYLTERRLE
ncbi:hypothetical protein [Haladaptatus sp. DYF46]|uniref:hypothetical protein n=1 Tax=Haladaptatus sp. DYF46 TaxID=2886041 RepID=UPI001E42B326|nr:hypothetical protein [Haladaptatus sp. DYF46]